MSEKEIYRVLHYKQGIQKDFSDFDEAWEYYWNLLLENDCVVDTMDHELAADDPKREEIANADCEATDEKAFNKGIHLESLQVKDVIAGTMLTNIDSSEITVTFETADGIKHSIFLNGAHLWLYSNSEDLTEGD